MLGFAKNPQRATNVYRKVSAGEGYMEPICNEVRLRCESDRVGGTELEFGILEEGVVKACSVWCEKNDVMNT